MSSYGNYQRTMENRFFKYTLFFSLLVHVLVIAQFPRRKAPGNHKPFKSIEITYHQPISKVKPEEKSVPKQPPRREELKQTAGVLSRKVPNSDFLVKDVSKTFQEMRPLKKQIVRLKEPQIKKRVIILSGEAKQISNPKYRSYNQIVHQKIQRQANINSEGIYNTGEKVRVTAIIDSKGILKQVKIIEDNSTTDQKLWDFSRKIVEEAAPFPPFPIDLKYPELSFSFDINFKDDE